MRTATPLTQDSTEIPRIAESIRRPETACLIAHGLLGRDGRGESFPTLRPAPLQNSPAGLCLHSLSEAVFAEALDPARLVCPLHRCGSSLSVIRFACGLFGLEDMVCKPTKSTIGTLEGSHIQIATPSPPFSHADSVFSTRLFSRHETNRAGPGKRESLPARFPGCQCTDFRPGSIFPSYQTPTFR